MIPKNQLKSVPSTPESNHYSFPTMSSTDNQPLCLQWLSRAQLTLGLLCLALQLVTTTLHGVAVIQLSVPLLFVASGLIATIAHWSSAPPGPYVALTVAVMSAVAAVGAVINLVAPVFGLKNNSAVGRGPGTSIQPQEIMYVMYVFMCLSEGVLSLLVAVLAYRFSTITPNQTIRDNCTQLPAMEDKKIILDDAMFQYPNNAVIDQKIHHYETLNPHVNQFSEC